MAAWFRRTPDLLGPDELPPGFAYPPELGELVAGTPLRNWEWLAGDRLRKAAGNFYKHHPRHLVPFAVRRGTRFVVCFDHSTVGPEGHEVLTLDALDSDATPVQHLPTLAQWVDAALEEESGPPPPPPVGAPGGGWVAPETGQCACVHHLDPFLAEVVPYGALAPTDEPPRTVGDLVLAREILAEEDYPGPELTWRNRAVGPFHWRVALVEGARWHYDDDGRTPIEQLVQFNPTVGLVVRPEGRDFHLHAPTMCRDGVQTLFARALLDRRVRRSGP